MGRAAAISGGLAFLSLLGARYLPFPIWVGALGLSVGFVGLAFELIAGRALKKHAKEHWHERAWMLALPLGFLAFVRSLTDPVGAASGQLFVDLAQNAFGPLSVSALVGACVFGSPGLASPTRLAAVASVAAITFAGAALGSVPDALGWPVGSRTFAALALFAAVFVSSLKRSKP